jgi:hypothetical protein
MQAKNQHWSVFNRGNWHFLTLFISTHFGIFQAQILRERVRLHILAEYSQASVLPYMQSANADALLIFSSGPPHSVVFNAGENTPRLFEQHKFDESLQK